MPNRNEGLIELIRQNELQKQKEQEDRNEFGLHPDAGMVKMGDPNGGLDLGNLVFANAEPSYTYTYHVPVSNPPVFQISHKGETLVKVTDDGKLECKDNITASKAAKVFIKNIYREGRNLIETKEELNQSRNEADRLKRDNKRLEDTVEFLIAKLRKYGDTSSIL